MHRSQQMCVYIKARGTSSQATAETDAMPAAHILCSHEQLLAYALPPSLWHNSQIADVGHVLGALKCHEGPLLNSFCWQVGALHVDHDSAKQTYPVWRQLKASLHNIISLLGYSFWESGNSATFNSVQYINSSLTTADAKCLE